MSHSRQRAAAARGQVQHEEAPHAEHAARRWPADDPEELAAQLRHQLRLLEAPAEREASADALRLATAYLKHAQTLAWRGVGRGDLDAPRNLLDSLLIVHPFLDAHLPDPPPKARAAVEIYATFQTFYVATEALEELRTRARLADRRRSSAERAVLRVLAASPDRHLRRGQVHERLDLDDEEKPTVVRVGQILARLYNDGLLVRLQSSAQGNPDTAFYALSGLGREVCQDSGLIDSPLLKTVEELLEEEPYQVLVTVATDPERSSDQRRVATGALAAGCLRLFSEVPIRALFAKYREMQTTQAGRPTRDLCRHVMLSAVLARVGEHQPSGRVTFRDDPNRWRILEDRDVSKAFALEAQVELPGGWPAFEADQPGGTQPAGPRANARTTPPGSPHELRHRSLTAEEPAEEPDLETLYLASLGKLEPVGRSVGEQC